MKVSELFEVKKPSLADKVDMTGKKHEGCGGKFQETSQHDDADGVLHCTKCGKETKRWLKPKKMNESKDPLVSAIRDNWMSWPVSKIVKFLKERIKAGDKQWAYLKSASDIELEDRVDDAKDEAKNQYGESLNEAFAIKLANGDWYSEQAPTLGPRPEGNLKVVTFKTMDAVDIFLNGKHGRKFDDCEVKRAPKNLYVTKKSVNEGMYVVKSKDGVEKRFRDADSAEAKAWKEKTAKNIKLAVYSNAYWEKKEEDSDDYDFVTPWKKIGDAEVDAIEAIVRDQHGAGQTDWTFGKAGEMDREGTSCATRVIRVQFEYGPDDDMGVDEPVSDTQAILVGRNPKKPKQIDFIKYVG